LEVHDSVIVEARAGSTIFVVRRVRTNEALIALIFCALPAWFAFTFASGVFRYMILAALLLAAAVAVARAFRIRIETTGERVRVLNYWRTFEFAWVDVKDVGVGAVTQGALPVPALAFGLLNGRTICAQATPRNQAELRKLARQLASGAPNAVNWRTDLLGPSG
jgi:hypothetical protein